jgi:uncharacterized oligopeptide transporter (OPT) family protein
MTIPSHVAAQVSQFFSLAFIGLVSVLAGFYIVAFVGWLQGLVCPPEERRDLATHFGVGIITVVMTACVLTLLAIGGELLTAARDFILEWWLR